MSTVEDVIKKILVLKPSLTREVVERLIEEERAKAAGLLTDEAAAHLVASNLGVDGSGEKIEAKLTIGALTTGLSDVSLTGRVIHVFPPRTFQRADGRQGKVLRMIIGDGTGTVPIVFWDDKADLVQASKVSRGKVVRILHGYSRDRNGEVEINVGTRGQAYMEPMDAAGADLPDMDKFFKTPAEVHASGKVNVVGVVVDRLPASTFTRKDGTEGKVSRLVLEEGGAKMNMVLWDDKVTELGGIEKGTKVRVINGASRGRPDGGYEIHLNWASEVEVLEKGVEPKEPVAFWTKIADAKEGMYSVNVAATVTQVGEEREFTRKDGGKGKVASLLLEDETGILRLSLWEDDVNLLKEIKPGTVVAIENGYTRAGFGSVDLNLGRNGRIRINPEDIKVRKPSAEEKVTEIKNLAEGQKNISIKGQLLDDPISRDVETVRGPARVVSFRIDDGTGEARVSLWRDLGDTVQGLTAGAQVMIENCNVREPFDGLMQVTSGAFTKVVILKK
jgi:replication factor A1